MRIIKIHVRGWAGVDDIFILEPPAPILELYSKDNAQGKSSFIEALLALAGGKAKVVDGPSTVRDGRKEAVEDVQWEHNGVTYSATIKVKKNGNMDIDLKDGEGNPVKAPRGALSEIFGEMYNPVEFRSWTVAKQLEVGQSLAGPEWCAAAAELEAKVTLAEEERKLAKRDLKAKGAVKLPAKVGRVDVVAVQVQLSEARAFNEKQAARQQVIDEARRKTEAAMDKLEQVRAALAAAEAEADKCNAALIDCELPQDISDTSALEQQLADASATNEAAGAYERALEDVKAITALATKVEAAERKVEATRTARDDHAQTITLPDDMAMTPEGLTWQGRPLSRASTGEGARITAKMALATGARLLVMDNAEGLDNGAVQNIAEECAAVEGGAVAILATRGAAHIDGALELRDGRLVEEAF